MPDVAKERIERTRIAHALLPLPRRLLPGGPAHLAGVPVTFL